MMSFLLTNKKSRLTLVLGLLLFFAQSKALAVEDAVKNCRQEQDIARIIAGCTAMIEHGKKIGGYPEPWVFINRGLAYEQIGETSKAIEDYSVAIKLDGDDPIGYMDRGNAYVKIGEFDKGRKDLEMARLRAKDDERIPYNLGVLEEKLGNDKEAVKHYSEAIRLDPEFTEAHFNLGVVEESLGNLKPAAEHYSEAIRFDPKFSLAYWKRAHLYCKLKQVKNSVEDWIMATNLGAIPASRMQNYLSKLDYYSGKNTGVMDSKTIDALNSWVADGCPGNK